MAEHGFDDKRRQDGSIDFDAYRAEAAKLRKEARNHFLWEVAVPLVGGAPVRLVSKATNLLADRWSATTAERP